MVREVIGSIVARNARKDPHIVQVIKKRHGNEK
jgi:hypothetical protein